LRRVALQQQRWRDDVTGEQGLNLRDPSLTQPAIRRALIASEIRKPASSQGFRHALATQLRERGHDIRTLQELLSCRELRTTMILTPLMNRNIDRISSPAETS
jgi:site-specific recombinase XerD